MEFEDLSDIDIDPKYDELTFYKEKRIIILKMIINTIKTNSTCFYNWYFNFNYKEKEYNIKYNEYDKEKLNPINPCVPTELLIEKIYQNDDENIKELYNILFWEFPYYRRIKSEGNNDFFRLFMFKKMENIIFSENLILLQNYIVDIINNLNEINQKYQKEFNTSLFRNQLITIYKILKEKKYKYKIEAYKKLYFYFNNTENFDYLMNLYLKYKVAKNAEKENLEELLFLNKHSLEDDDYDLILSSILLDFKLNLIKFFPNENKFLYYEYNINEKKIYILIIMGEKSKKYYLLYNKEEYERYKNYYSDFEIKKENIKNYEKEKNDKYKNEREKECYISIEPKNKINFVNNDFENDMSIEIDLNDNINNDSNEEYNINITKGNLF